jgi:4-amino-4-deoxy-L-arabinose transferase-like glycosyltransferase
MMIDINGRFRQILPETSRWVDRSWMAGLALASLILMVWQLGLLPLQDGYEGTIAQAAKSSLERLESLGALEAIDSALNGLLDSPWPGIPTQTEIPLSPIVSWNLVLSYAIGGVNETMSRLPSAVLAACSVPLIYALARELFAGRLAAVTAAVLYLMSLPVVRLGRLAAPPGALLFEVLLLLLCLFRSRRDVRWSLGLGLVTGMLGLTEGWMGLLWGIFGISFLAWDTPRLLRCPYLWWGLGLGLLPLGLWGCLSYAYQGWPFLTMQMAGSEEIGGTIAGSGFRASWGWTIAMQVGFPAIVFLPSALQYVWRNRDFSWAKFLLSWSILYSLLLVVGVRQSFSIAGFGVYPLVSLIVGVYLAQHWLPHWATDWTSTWNWATDWEGPSDPAIDSSSHSSPQIQGASPREMKNWGWIFAVAAVAMGCGAGWSLGEGLGWIAGSAGLMALSCSVVMVLCRQRRRSEALAVLAWGTYVALFAFVNSEQSLWDAKNDYPVQPVAQMIAKRTPSQAALPIYTSHSVRRSSLDFYSDRQVIPASMTELEEHLLQDEQPFLLVDLDIVRQLPRSKVKFLGQVRVQLQGRSQTWALLTRQGV